MTFSGPIKKGNIMDESRDEVTVESLRILQLETPPVTILERSLVVDGSRAQAQVAEQYEKIQALSLGRSKDLILDLAPARPNRLRPRRVEKQLVVRSGDPAELLVEDRETVTRQPNHRALKARKIRIAAAIVRDRPARRRAVVMHDFFHCIPF